MHETKGSVTQQHNFNTERHENVILDTINKVMNPENTDILTLLQSRVNDKSLWKACQVVKSPADGHCLLHSVISSMKTQLLPPIEMNICTLLYLIQNELFCHLQRYVDFMDEKDFSHMKRSFQNYACYKIYDSNFVDIVPNILCNIFDIQLFLIMEGRGVMCVDNTTRQSKGSLILQKVGEHYNGIKLADNNPL